MAGDASVVERVGAKSCGLQHKKQLYALSWLEPDHILWGEGIFLSSSLGHSPTGRAEVLVIHGVC